MNPENNSEAADQKTRPNVSMIKIFKKIWLLALSVCFTFTVTIGTFPAITADTKSTLADGGSWAREGQSDTSCVHRVSPGLRPSLHVV
ncbi:equilibrative nucleoside transporter 1-like [Plectropomus leopardus]|uniref:equilibrative nucleoside transporter 1-like n=1 Tax=Plectropomus leopardus TaxID=160734 RepID=UPI001C4CC6C0|nr:equilibrative nucleoside transporter 1-like [Plectropomus leopardus]